MKKMRFIRAFLLTTTICGTPGLAHADPVSLTAIVGTALGGAIASSAAVTAAIGATLASILGAVVTAGIGFLGQALFGQNQSTRRQSSSRTRDFDPHPNFRFAFGEFRQEGSVLFHHVYNSQYYMVILLNSVPSEEITRVVIQEHIDLDVVNELGADLYNMNKIVNNPTVSEIWDEEDFQIWVGLGDHTQAPQRWLNEIGPSGHLDPGILQDTDTWSGLTVAFVKFQAGRSGGWEQRFAYGKPPPLYFEGKWSKVYDPRLDSTSGVTGASGAHRIDDPATWEYSNNPALCGLMLATHEYALGFDQEMIPIQQWADAADAWDSEWSTTTSGGSQTVSLDPVANAGTTHAAGIANGVTVAGFSATETIQLQLPEGQDYGAFAPWGSPSPANQGSSGAVAAFDVAPNGDVGQTQRVGDAGVYDGYEAARETFGTRTITGGTSYTFYIQDTNPGDNNGGFEIAINSDNYDVWGCNGLVLIEERELELLDPVLACFAAQVDTTDGLLGIRAGVWEAPTETLSQPIGDEIEQRGARDAGFDLVRAKFIWPGGDYEETDGPGYALRSGPREFPLDLPLVGSREQAARLEKIVAKRAEPNRTVTALWDGREANRRLGERVNFALPGSARAASTYVIDSKQVITQEVDDGFEVSVRMTLVEDVEDTYTAPDYTPAASLPSIPPTETDMAAPTVVAAQSDYYTGSSAVARLKVTATVTAAVASASSSIVFEVTDGGGYEALIAASAEAGQTTYVAYLNPATIGTTYTARARAVSTELGQTDWGVSNSVTITTPALDYDHDDYSAEYA